MANYLCRRNLKLMVLVGVGVLLMVELIKIALVIEDYEVEKSETDDGRPQDAAKTDGTRSGKALKEFEKSLSAGLEGEAIEKKEGKAAATKGEKHPRLKQDHREEKFQMEAFRLKNDRKDADMDEKETWKEMDSSKPENDDVDVDLELNVLKNIFSKDNDIAVSSGKSPQKTNIAQIYINTSRPVLNPHPFRYLINSPDLCKNVNVFLLCYVHTAVKHHKRRKRIRQTWGNQTNYPGVEIRVVFFVGLPQLNTTKGRLYQDYLGYESKRYGDIVQEDFLDTYRNLSHKGVGALKWVSTYCNHTAYVLKTDDDMFVNMYVIINHLRNLYAENFRRRLIMCYVFWRMHVDREGGQWSLPKDYFPDDLYPPYCSGMGFVMTGDVAIAMYRVSPYVPFLWVDDAFISGVLPAALQGAVNHTSWARTYCAAFEMGVYTHPTEWYKYTFSHVHNETLNLMTWEGLTDIVRNRTIPRPSVIRPGHLADEYVPLEKLFSPPKDDK